jgi:hypothetical protein
MAASVARNEESRDRAGYYTACMQGQVWKPSDFYSNRSLPLIIALRFLRLMPWVGGSRALLQRKNFFMAD